MKRTILTIVAVFMIGMVWAQSKPGKIGAVITKTTEGISNIEKSFEQTTNVAVADAISNTKTMPTLLPFPQTNIRPIVPKPNEIKVFSLQQYFNDDWIEVGQITLKRTKVIVGQMGIPRYEDGYGELPFKEIKAVLYVKEFNNGNLIYRVLFQDQYYSVASNGKVCLDINYNGNLYNNVILYCSLPY